MTYYIVEHPSRGTLRPDSEPGEPHFSWSGYRSDPEKAWRFDSIEKARKAIETCVPNLRVRGDCVIRRSPDPNATYASGDLRWGKDAWEQVWP